MHLPRWKINSFLSEISVCWSCTEKIRIKIERAFSVILWASPATRRSFQPSLQRPTVAAENLRFNTQLATANARWRLPSHTIVVSIGDPSSVSTVCWHKRLLIEVVTMAFRLGANVYCNRGHNSLVGESTWSQNLIIEVATPPSHCLGANFKWHHVDS